MSGILYIAIALGLIAAYLLYRYLRLRRELKNISSQLETLISGDSEKMLDITFVDRELERLAGLFNQYNDKQRMIVAGAMKDEAFLKDSVASISHDLRTPLTVIIGHLQLMDKDNFTPDQKERIDTVYNKALRMKELVDAFYEYSLINTSNIRIEPEKINLNNLLTGLISDLAPSMEEKNITPDIQIPNHSVYITTDRNMLDRIIQNLITNAVRYSAGNIGIKLEDEGEDIRLTVTNPVAKDADIDPNRIFERFYTGDSSRNNGGTGLGLA
ncbi:MAG: HAMP domain-containing histidine kinase, partial [Clostridiales bacterium]|nr:HAMP domain-containing histidine kinase [Clostridiales bacterium]